MHRQSCAGRGSRTQGVGRRASRACLESGEDVSLLGVVGDEAISFPATDCFARNDVYLLPQAGQERLRRISLLSPECLVNVRERNPCALRGGGDRFALHLVVGRRLLDFV